MLLLNPFAVLDAGRGLPAVMEEAIDAGLTEFGRIEGCLV